MRHISRCFNSQLAKICQKTITLEDIDAKIKPYLPKEMQDHCRVGSFNHSCLILIVSDPVWATQLRYSLPELRDRLRQQGGIHQLASIKIQLSEPNSLKTKQSIKPNLSENARNTILLNSQQCLYAPLRQALEKLILKR